jgi:hypothetical protein
MSAARFLPESLCARQTEQSRLTLLGRLAVKERMDCAICGNPGHWYPERQESRCLYHRPTTMYRTPHRNPDHRSFVHYDDPGPLTDEPQPRIGRQQHNARPITGAGAEGVSADQSAVVVFVWTLVTLLVILAGTLLLLLW